MSTHQHPTIMMIAGEASGDNLGAGVVRAIKHKLPHANITGIGGQAMKAAGQTQQYDAAKIAVVGLIEILKHYRDIKQAWNAVTHIIKTTPPDLLILIDYPGMNLRLAKLAKQHNIKVLYYVSPQVWAWHQSRVKKIKSTVDHMAVIFPFEATFYQEYDVPVSYVGSPIIETVKPIGDKLKVRQELGLKPDKLVIALGPGSRHSELSRLLPVLVKSTHLLRQIYPNVQFILPIASTINRDEILQYFKHSGIQPQLTQHAHRAIEAADLLICASGTVTLESAYIGTPLIIIYKTSPLTYHIGKHLIKVDKIGLCNIVAEKTVAPELIQHAANPANIVKHAQILLDSEIAQQQMHQGLAEIKQKLGQGGAAENVANIAIRMLKE